MTTGLRIVVVLLVLYVNKGLAARRSFNVGVSESADPGHVITCVRRLYLSWLDGEGQFRITAGNKDDRFAVRSDTGELIVKRYLNFDIDPHYELRVANDIGDKKEIKIKISVADDPNYPPFFNPRCYIPPRTRNTTDIWPLMGTLHSLLGYQALFTDRKRGSRSAMALDNDRCEVKVYSIVKGDSWDYYIPVGTTPTFSFGCTNDQTPRRATPTLKPYWNGSYDRPEDSAINPLWFVDGKKKRKRHILAEINLKDMTTESPSVYECTMDLQAPNIGIKASMKFSLEAIGCPDGFYGGNCSEPCVCQNGGSCHPFNGACKCPDGWKGRACDIKDPKVIMSPTYQNVTSGQTVRLSCEVVNVDPVSTFGWALNGKELHCDDGNRMVTSRGFNTQFNRTFVNVTIDVKVTSLDKSGEYACAYRATDGKIYRQFAKIALEGKFSPDCRSCFSWAMSAETIALYCASTLGFLFFLALMTECYLKHRRAKGEKPFAMLAKKDPDVKKPIAEFPDMVRRATVENAYTV